MKLNFLYRARAIVPFVKPSLTKRTIINYKSQGIKNNYLYFRDMQIIRPKGKDYGINFP